MLKWGDIDQGQSLNVTNKDDSKINAAHDSNNNSRNELTHNHKKVEADATKSNNEHNLSQSFHEEEFEETNPIAWRL